MTASIETLLKQTYAHRRNKDLTAAHECALEALAQARKGDAKHLLARTLMMVGQIERDKDQPEAAAAPYAEAVSILRRSNDNANLAHAIRHLGDLETERKHYQAAEEAYSEALTLYKTVNDVSALALANAVRAYAVLKDQAGQPNKARTLWTEAKALYETSGIQDGVDECDARLAR